MTSEPSQPLLPMLAAMAAAVLALMGVTSLERRLFPAGASELAHWGLLAGGVFLSVAVYTAVMRALMRGR